MKISDPFGPAIIQYRELARAAEALRPMTELMSSSAALALQAQSHQEWLGRSLAAVMSPQIDVSQFATSVGTMLGLRSSVSEALAAATLPLGFDIPGIKSLTEAANFAMGLGVQKGIQDALASFSLPLGQMETALQAVGRINAASIFGDLDRLASVRESVLQQYAGLAGILDASFDEELLDAAEDGVAAVRAELALEQPLSDTNLLDAIEAVLQRAQALADNPAVQKAVLWILALIIGNVLSGVVGAEWTLQRTEADRLREVAAQHEGALHEEARTRMLKELAEQLQTVADATELHAVITRSAHLRAQPDSVSSSYTLLSPGDTVLIREQENGWLRVTAHVPERGLMVGWVYAKRAKAVLE